MNFLGSYFALATALIISYLMGSFSPSIFLAKRFRGIDVRDYGSRNAGATNATRVLGMGLGKWVYVIDISKGVLSALLGLWFFGSIGGYLAALACILGHMWPVYYQFKGGKGVATTAGAAVVLDWRAALPAIILFFLLVLIFRYVSLGSMLGMLTFAIVTGIKYTFGSFEFLAALIIFVLVVLKHRGNIKRLLTGTENKVFQKKKGGEIG